MSENLNKRARVITPLVLITIFLLLIFSTTAAAAMLGDVNNDSFINILDVTMVNNHVLGISTLTNAQKEVADVNGDGLINILDVTLIAQMSLGIITQFPTQTTPPPNAPPVPGLFSPADGANAIGTSINFQWNASSGADKYELEVRKVSNNMIFKNPVLGNVTSTIQTGFLNDGTQYRWRVRAGNTAGWSAWSDYRIINNGVLPAAPTLVSPANNISVSGISVSFQWSAVAGANKYELEIVRESDGFVRKIPLGNVTSSTQSGFPNDGTAYKWRVRAGNYDGWGAWSLYRTFTNGNLPAAPALIAPADNAVAFGTTLIFDWKLSGGATKYELEVRRADNNTVYRTIPLNGNVGSHMLTGLPNDGTQFRWAVRAGNNNGWGSYSEYRTFTNGFLFAAPVQTLPAANATVSGTVVTFEWTAVNQANRYHIELTNVNQNTITNIYPGNVPSVDRTGFPDDGTQYRWRVRAGSANGWGAWSGYRNFINDTPLASLAAPSLVSPAPGATAGGKSVTFKWTAVSGADDYELEVVRISDRAVVVHGPLESTATEKQISSFPDDGTQYMWRVRARAGGEDGAWSLYRGFENGRSDSGSWWSI